MPARKLSDSAKAFRKFLSDNGIGPVEAAEAIDVTHPAVIGWASGTRKPGATNRKRIRIWTGGLVTEDGWGPDRKSRRDVVPFAPRGPEAA